MITATRTLESRLLVPRKKVTFVEVDGEVKPLHSDSSKNLKPIVISLNGSGDVKGYRSGGRNGLVAVDGVPYKLDACNIGAAFHGKGPYKATHYTRGFGYDPEGGKTLAGIEKKVGNTLRVNERLGSEEIPVAHHPTHIVKFFEYWDAEIDPQIGRSRPESPPFWARQMGGAFMEMFGDTRLHEIYALPVRDDEAAHQVGYGFGLSVGAQKRILADYWWRGSSGLRNVVAFCENGRELGERVFKHSDGEPVHVYLTDWEDAVTYREFYFGVPLWEKILVYPMNVMLELIGENMSEINQTGIEELQTTQEEYTRQSLFRSMESPRRLIVDGVYGRKRSVAPEPFRTGFIEGFGIGYRNPDARRTVTIGDLREAFVI